MPGGHRIRRRSLAAAALLVALAAPQGSPQDRRVVRVLAERFTFTPSQVKVKRGTVVEFRVRSDDTNHGFRIKGTKTNIVIPKRGRGEMTVTFEATTAGRYQFECSKMCGAGHSTMKGAIVVKPRSAQ